MRGDDYSMGVFNILWILIIVMSIFFILASIGYVVFLALKIPFTKGIVLILGAISWFLGLYIGFKCLEKEYYS